MHKKLALLHMKPEKADLAKNRRILENALDKAAEHQVDWLITPELCTSGYCFDNEIGHSWISPQPDRWTTLFLNRAGQAGICLFLACPEQDRESGRYYNSVLVFEPGFGIRGRHRKIAVQKGFESWSSKGETAKPILCQGVRVGVIICADAWYEEIPLGLKEQGAQIFISPAAWPPEPYSPYPCWESITRKTGLPLVICNRTGQEDDLPFYTSESLVMKDGRKLAAYASEEPALLTINWDFESMQPLDSDFCRISI
ncbi:(R)-stereoselective amidase [bioreactor metagenome]|uniref:Nitrilase/cyanide hydratase and apolipoprotein N-acyltransferase n=2 Tax=root TaxID=1 RepID=A0AB33HXY8_9CHLR|nr:MULTISPECIES: carbon-nitrogen hydrolase family protein [Dehalococcoides]MEA4878834.1 carbon-nitrogen hydrolase family protein [Dehalococcoides mccartyi]POZ59468.1 Carbon-nitrogen hydrolase family protein [Dehalococcoides mccartyi]BAZ97939.1 Nitrilase/cyanide hydratase and apolipoprotein N-acyltransferase [Dehalococcoides mccartyi]